MKIVASAKVSDAGGGTNVHNFQSIERTGDDDNFTVRMKLGAFSEDPLTLMPIVTLFDARQGFTADLFQDALGQWYVDVAIAPGHTSGFRIVVVPMLP